jgi:hypothetical protein
MRFIAKRQNSDETVTAILTCSDKTNFSSPKDFLDRLKKGVSDWIRTTESGKSAWNYSGGDFNFGDLASNSEDSFLLTCLSKHGISSFEISLVTNVEEDFNFDTVLADIEE